MLTVTEGNVVDHAAIIEYVVDHGERYCVQEIAIDRWNSTAVSTALQGEGFTINQFGQGFASMAAVWFRPGSAYRAHRVETGRHRR